MVAELHGTLQSPSKTGEIEKALLSEVSYASRESQTASKPHHIPQVHPLECKPDYEAAFSKSALSCLDDRIERLGEHPVACGGYADIWKGSLGHLPVAIKVMRPFSSNNGRRIEPNKLLKRLWYEFRSWSCLQHENVISCLGFSYDFSPDDTIPSLISPWMENGTAKLYIQTHPDVSCLDLLLGIANGLSYLHNRNPIIVHGDLRADNVLISDNGNPRLSDFGLSKILSEFGGTTTTTEIAGSLRWMAPELLHGTPVSVSSDIWAYGMTILELLSGKRPWYETKFDHMVLQQVIGEQLPMRPQDEDGHTISDDVWGICQACWTYKASARPSMDVVKSSILALAESEMNVNTWQPTPPNSGPISISNALKDLPRGFPVVNQHVFIPPTLSDSRGPCPALNTLANHGYLPRNGRNIWPEDMVTALKHKGAYRIDDALARGLVYGGLFLMGRPPPLSLHQLPRRGQLPLQDEFLTLDDVARKQLAALNPPLVHQEMALGEWALVLDIFGRAHGGKVPSDLLRTWLGKNQLPEGWRPTHEQGYGELVLGTTAIRQRMNEHRDGKNL